MDRNGDVHDEGVALPGEGTEATGDFHRLASPPAHLGGAL